MARNPSTWNGATPFNYNAKLDKSGGTHWDNPTTNGEDQRKSTATPWNHSGKIGKSGHEGMGRPYPKQSDRSELQAMAVGNGKAAPSILPSGPEPKPTKPPAKWFKRGYQLGSVPTTDPDSYGDGRKAARKIG